MVGDGLSTQTARSPYIYTMTDAARGSWASCYQDDTQAVVMISALRSDGQTARFLHRDLARDPNVTLLGETFEEAQATMQGIDPSIAAAMEDAYVPH